MSNPQANAIPYPQGTGSFEQAEDSAKSDGQQQTAEGTTSSETTGGGREPVAWVEVAVNLSPVEAAIIRGRLETSDIPALIQQESIGSVMGLTVGPLGSAKVLVPEAMAETALSILADTFEPDDAHYDDAHYDEGEEL